MACQYPSGNDLIYTVNVRSTMYAMTINENRLLT